MLNTVEAIATEFLAETVQQIAERIEPDAGLRILGQVTCNHDDISQSRLMCLDCGLTMAEAHEGI